MIIEYIKKNWKNILIILVIGVYVYVNYYQKYTGVSYENNGIVSTITGNTSKTIKSNSKVSEVGSTYDIKNTGNELGIYNTDKVPNYAINTLIYIRNYNAAPDGFVGGRVFTNYQKVLPKGVAYTEWDVKKYKKGVNRGPERLVTSIQHAYYTSDHYKTFIQIQ